METTKKFKVFSQGQHEYDIVALHITVGGFAYVPHSKNLIINHCTVSGITLNRCWAQLIFKR